MRNRTANQELLPDTKLTKNIIQLVLIRNLTKLMHAAMNTRDSKSPCRWM